jgi:antibiotic biosynthesis monooxygenase (ABM) superfamily enzyme
METNSKSKKPKVWKMLLIAWLYAYPLINILFAIIGPYVGNLHPLLRSLVITIMLVPALGLGIPAIQKKFYNWTIR